MSATSKLGALAAMSFLMPQRMPRNLGKSVLSCRLVTVRAMATLALRSYQQECIQQCLTAIDEGKQRIAVSLATGGGKTVIFSHLISQIPSRGARNQTLIVVHRRELLEQAANHCRRACPDNTIEIEMAHHSATGQADITVCSLQSLIRRLDKYDKDRIKMIIIDEAHHAAAKSYIDILNHFGANSADSETVVVGFSATLFRRDGLQLASVFDHIVFHKDYMSMMRDGFLCNAKLTTVALADVSLKGIKMTGADGDFAPGQLAERVNTTAANKACVGAWLDRGSNRKSTIVFAVDIQHVMDLANCFREHGIDARAVSSRNSKLERTEVIAGFRRGDFPVLVNCGILTEGFDSPQIDCVLLCRPTKSVGLLVQMIGRGLRLAPGKEDCHILDMTSCLDVGVASVPSLFGLDPTELVNTEKSMEELDRQAAERAELAAVKETVESPSTLANEAPLAVSYIDYDDMQDLMSEHEVRGTRHISQMSPLNWLQTDVDKYILTVGNKGFIRVYKEDVSMADEKKSQKDEDASTKETWTGTYTYKVPAIASPALSRPQQLFDKVVSLERAISAADTKAINIGQRSLMLRNAPWRLTEASAAQKAFMEKLGSKNASGRVVTRGQAHDFITRFTHGAKSFVDRANKEKKAKHKLELKQFRQKEVEAAKATREADKVARRDRVYQPEVSIGPISQARSHGVF